MNKTLLVLKNEFINTIARRSFLVTLFVVPLATIILTLVITALQPGVAPNALSRTVLQPDAPEVVREGFIDQGSLVRQLPDWVAPDRLRRFESEAQADQALAAGQIRAYYIIPADYLARGTITVVQPDASPFSGLTDNADMRDVLRYNLLNGDAALTRRLAEPMVLERRSLGAGKQNDPENLLTFFVTYGVTMLFYIVILGSSSLMLNSITNEKQNRVMELLVTSVTPLELLTGKIIALGLAGLLQTLVWSAIGLSVVQFRGALAPLAGVHLPPQLILWGVLFFTLGYALYAGLMAGVGALVPNLREAGQITTVIILPLILPLMLISAIIRNPSGPLAIILSLVPFTAPVTVMMRLSTASVPLWQILLSVALLTMTSILLIRSVARLFRAQNLLSGQTFRFKGFVMALFGRA